MCYNISYREPDAQKLHSRYAHLLPALTLPLDLPTYYFVSGFDHPALPVITHDDIRLTEWGLIPFWVKDAQSAKALQNKTLNAVGENVFETASFKDCIINQRCLVPANGFIEWRDFKGAKYPHYIYVKSQEMFSLGAIYSTWTDKGTGEMKTTFSVLTTPANPLVEKIHNIKKRMPLILSMEDEGAWIDPKLPADAVSALIKPYSEIDMDAYTVSKYVNNARNNRNTPEVLEKVMYQELNETPTLF